MSYVLVNKKTKKYVSESNGNTSDIKQAFQGEDKKILEEAVRKLKNPQDISIEEFSIDGPFVLRKENNYIAFKTAKNMNSGIKKTTDERQAYCFSCKHEASLFKKHASKQTDGFAIKKLDLIEKDEPINTAPANPKTKRVTLGPTVKRYLYKKAKGRCRLCGRFIMFEDMTIDHIIPLAKGGTNDMDNLQCSCLTCNQIKKDILPEEFLSKISEIYNYQRRKNKRKISMFSMLDMMRGKI